MTPDIDADVPASQRNRNWLALAEGFVLCVIVVGPSFLFEEFWHGRPMIDQGGALWLVPAAIMALGFFFGGFVAGRHRGQWRSAFTSGAAVSVVTMLVILVADVIRRRTLTN